MKILVLVWLMCSSLVAYAQGGSGQRSVEERLAELEANQSLRYVSFSGFLVSSFDNLSVSESFPKNANYNDLNYLRLKFSLNIDAEISPQIRLYSRFTAAKFMNNWRTQGGSPFYNEDIEGAHSYSSSHVFMEKAYVDLSSPDSLWTISIGRLPTLNGTPSHYLDMLPRQGTYPLLSFNAPLDGVAVTYRLDSYLASDQEWAVRFLYTPFSDLYWGGGSPFLRPPSDDTSGVTPVGNDRATLSNMFAVQSDFTIKNHRLFEEMGMIWQYYRTEPLRISAGLGTSNLSMQSSNATVSWEAKGFLYSDLDLSVSYAYTELISQGLFAPGLGLGTDQDDAHVFGGRSLIAARYRWEKWAVGIERVDGDKYSGNYPAISDDLTGFYLTQGVGHHLYVVTKIMNLVTLRAGYRQQDLSHYSIELGPVPSTDRVIKTAYVALRTDF